VTDRWTDRQTDRQQDDDSKHRASIASRGQLQATYTFRFVCKDILANICNISEFWDLESF